MGQLDRERSLTRSLQPSGYNTRTCVRDRQTDGQPDTGRRQYLLRLCITSRGKKNALVAVSRYYGLAPIRLKPARLKNFYGGLRLRKSTAVYGCGFGSNVSYLRRVGSGRVTGRSCSNGDRESCSAMQT